MLEHTVRYHRQTQLPELGDQGQQKLKDARVLVIGAGGLGSPALWYLAAAGIGTLGICDGDSVELSNLNRQILHTEASLGRLKVDSAAENLLRLRQDLNLKRYPYRVDAENITHLIRGWDLVLDCTDTLTVRHMISDAAYAATVPLIEAGVSGWEGFVFPILSTGGPCYRCLYPEEPETAEPEPSIGAVCGTVGAWMAQEGIRWLIGMPTSPGRLVRINGLTGIVQTVNWGIRRSCDLCNGLSGK